MLCYVIKHRQEMFKGHFGAFQFLGTIAATMAAREVATQSALPEQLLQRMLSAQALVSQSCFLECSI
jgi:hypothetical protein